MADYTIALDAGHGGSDPGAVYNSRREKDDTLALTLAIGELLSDAGIDVFYVRDSDIYETPFKKATDANNANADLFVSIHRNSSEIPNQYSGIETLVYNNSGKAGELAENINDELAKTGAEILGITNRPNLVVLRRTKMPAALVEVGFINNDKDNQFFDEQFDELAAAIANGIINTLYNNDANAPSADSPPKQQPQDKLYRVQVGAFSNKDNADRLLNTLLTEGFPAFIIYEDGLYKVQVGAFAYLNNAIKMEERLRRYRYNTYIVYD